MENNNDLPIKLAKPVQRALTNADGSNQIQVIEIEGENKNMNAMINKKLNGTEVNSFFAEHGKLYFMTFSYRKL